MHIQSYEDDKVAISVAPNPHPDRFAISYDRGSGMIGIKRLDTDTGWGQDLALKVLDKDARSSYVVRVGPSIYNYMEVAATRKESSRVSFEMSDERIRAVFGVHKKVYVAMATIPSRAKTESFFNHVKSILEDQTLRANKVFVTVADSYERFGGRSLDRSSLDRLACMDGVEVIVERDYGPASKYLGPMINRYDEIGGQLLVVVDDDRFYSRNLLRNFALGFSLYPEMRFAAGDNLLYFSKDYPMMDDSSVDFQIRANNHGFAGFYGFCLRVDGMEDIVPFHTEILRRVNGAFFHDDGIMRAYANFKGDDMLMLKHKGCFRIEREPPDALCQTTPFDREKVEREMFKISSSEGFLVGS